MRTLLHALFDPLPGDRRYVRFIGSTGPIGRVPMMTRTGRIYNVLRPGAAPTVHQVVNNGDTILNGDDLVVIPT